MNKPKQKSVFDRNSTEIVVLPSGKTVHIPKCKTIFKLWRGKRIKDTYGGKTLLTFRGKPLFAELVTLQLLEKEGWHGVWVYGSIPIAANTAPACQEFPISLVCLKSRGRSWKRFESALTARAVASTYLFGAVTNGGSWS